MYNHGIERGGGQTRTSLPAEEKMDHRSSHLPTLLLRRRPRGQIDLHRAASRGAEQGSMEEDRRGMEERHGRLPPAERSRMRRRRGAEQSGGGGTGAAAKGLAWWLRGAEEQEGSEACRSRRGADATAGVARGSRATGAVPGSRAAAKGAVRG